MLIICKVGKSAPVAAGELKGAAQVPDGPAIAIDVPEGLYPAKGTNVPAAVPHRSSRPGV
jgi:hypothetical protein